jgi:DNA polymerase V
MYVLVDCNNFYVSCERVFNPKLNGKAVVVLSNNDGCVIARSKEAKALGIPMGAPAFKNADFFQKHGVQACSSNYALYGDLSQRVMETLRTFTPSVEVYSIDEAFLFFENQPLTEDYMRLIQERILQWTGIPTSIGIAPTKTLAKAANHAAKKFPQLQGICLLDTEEKREILLKSLNVEDVWGLGRQLSAFLHAHQMNTAWDVCQADDRWIRDQLSVVVLRTVWELRGNSCLLLEDAPPPRKAIMCSKSFGRPVEKMEELAEALSAYTARAAEKIRSQDCLTGYLEVFLETDRFKEDLRYSNSARIVLPQPTAYTPELIHYAKQALEIIFRKGLSYKKTGILLGALTPQNNFQPDLFEAPAKDLKKQQILMEIIDKKNKGKGKKLLRFASEGIEQPWQMRQKQRSSRFTTRWEELLTIRI